MADFKHNALVAALESELSAQANVVDLYERYYLGDNRPAYSSAEWKRIFGEQLEQLTANWCQTVVDIAAERLAVTGVTFPSQTKDGGERPDGGDPVALEIWESNQLGSLQARAHTVAVYAGRSYVLVEKDPAGGVPIVTVEHPSQCFVRMNPAREGDRLAAIKKWEDYDDADPTEPTLQVVTLYLPGRRYELRRPRKKVNGTWGYGDLEPVADAGGNGIKDPMPVVPMVPLENRPLLLASGPNLVGKTILLGGISDLQAIPPLQDAVDKTLADWMVSGEFDSYPQRYGVGITPPIDPKTKKPLTRDEWQVGRDRFLLTPNKDAKFGAFPTNDGAGMYRRIEALVSQIAAFTRTPAHYLLVSLANTSGDTLKAAEAGLVQRIVAKQGPLGNGWEQSTRIACGYMGDMDRFRDRRCTVAWKDPEVRTEGEAVDAAIKLYQSGLLPHTMVMERLGYDPQQTERAGKLLGHPEREDPARPKTPSPAAPDKAAAPEVPVAA